MMRVERVDVALLLLVRGQTCRYCHGWCEVEGIGKPCWVASSWPRKSYGQETKSSHRKRKPHEMVVHGVDRLNQ